MQTLTLDWTNWTPKNKKQQPKGKVYQHQDQVQTDGTIRTSACRPDATYVGQCETGAAEYMMSI